MHKFAIELLAKGTDLIKQSDFESDNTNANILLNLAYTITKQIVKSINSFLAITQKIVFSDANFLSADKIGIDMARQHSSNRHFFIELQKCLYLYNKRASSLIGNLDDSEQGKSFSEIFVSQFTLKIQQSYIKCLHKKLEIQFNIENLTELPDELTPVYVDTIVKKLANIPMVEICFDGRIMHTNPAMGALKKSIGRDLEIDEIIPENLHYQIENQFCTLKHYKSFFSEAKINERLFQKFILVMPSTQVYIVFFLEAIRLENDNDETKSFQLSPTQNKSGGLKNIKEAFLANMSHELRTPLHEIIGFADLLSDELEDNLSDSHLEYIQLIQQGGERLLELINYLLVVSGKQPQAENFQNCYSGFNFLIELANSVFEVTNEKSIEIETIGDDLGDDLYGDKDRIFLTLSEILNYILKYIIKGSSITLSYINDKNNVTFFIIVPENCNIKFTDEMILSHAMFFIDLMHGQFVVKVSEHNDKVFEIMIPNNSSNTPLS